MGDYQLRGQNDVGDDTGELVYKDTLEEGMEEFLSGRYWKLSWTRPNGQRIQFLRRTTRDIEIVYPSEWLPELVQVRDEEGKIIGEQG